MSLQNDLGLTEAELKNASPSVQDRILSGYARIRGLELIQNHQMLNRQSKYLLSKAKAVRQSQGLNMGSDAEDEIVLGDKITNLMGNAAALVLAAGIAAAGAVAWKWLDTHAPPSAVEPTPPAIVDTDTDSTYRVEKWVPSQNEINAID